MYNSTRNVVPLTDEHDNCLDLDVKLKTNWSQVSVYLILPAAYVEDMVITATVNPHLKVLAKCQKCEKVGHITPVCRSKPGKDRPKHAETLELCGLKYYCVYLYPPFFSLFGGCFVPALSILRR